MVHKINNIFINYHLNNHKNKSVENIIKKYGHNNLTKPIIYELNNLSIVDKNIIKITQICESYLNNLFLKSYDLSNISSAFISLYHSNSIVNNFPTIENKTISNNKPSLHIIFGLTISQLVSLSLYTDTLYYVNKNFSSNNVSVILRKKCMNYFFDELVMLEPIINKNIFISNLLDKLYVCLLAICIKMYEESEKNYRDIFLYIKLNYLNDIL